MISDGEQIPLLFQLSPQPRDHPLPQGHEPKSSKDVEALMAICHACGGGGAGNYGQGLEACRTCGGSGHGAAPWHKNVDRAVASAEVARSSLKRAALRTKQLFQSDLARAHASSAMRLLTRPSLERNGPAGVAEARAHTMILSQQAINKDDYKGIVDQLRVVEDELKDVQG